MKKKSEIRRSSTPTSTTGWSAWNVPREVVVVDDGKSNARPPSTTSSTSDDQCEELEK